MGATSREALPTFEKGAVLTAAQLNQIVTAVLNKVSGGAGIKTTRFGNQIVIDAIEVGVGRDTLTQMQIVSDQGDYLVCRKVDANGVVGPADINVMKPWTLRRSPFEGLTVNGVAYTYSGNAARQADGTEDQVITQDYFAGAVIYTYLINISIEVTTGVFTSWIDANLDGRDWGEPE